MATTNWTSVLAARHHVILSFPAELSGSRLTLPKLTVLLLSSVGMLSALIKLFKPTN